MFVCVPACTSSDVLESKSRPMDLTEITSVCVMPRSATPLKAPLLVLAGNRFRVLRLVADQPKALPYGKRHCVV